MTAIRRTTQLRRILRAESICGLREVLLAWSKSDLTHIQTANLKASRLPVYAIGSQEAIEWWFACSRGLIDLNCEAPRVLAQAEQLLAALAEQPPLDCDAACRHALRLTCYVAEVFIPAASHVGRYNLGLHAGQSHLTGGNDYRVLSLPGEG